MSSCQRSKGSSRCTDRLLWRPAATALTAIAIGSPTVLLIERLAAFSLNWDDFPFVRDSLNWSRLMGSLWEPICAHVCPPFRLLTRLLLIGQPPLDGVPNRLALGCVIGAIALATALYVFVVLELRSRAVALVAVLWGCTTTAYFCAVATYALSQSLWAAATVLASLSCFARWRRGGRASWYIGGCCLALLAPAWHASGVLAGPVGAAYLWLAARGHRCGVAGHLVRPSAIAAAGPIVAVSVFGLIAIWASAGHVLVGIMPPEYGVDVRGFNPLRGAYLAARCLVEHVCFWSFGLPTHLSFGQWLVFFPLLVAACWWWLPRGQERLLAWVGLVWLLCGYLLVYSLRWPLGLPLLRVANWYLVGPHIGLVLFVASGMTAYRSFKRAESGGQAGGGGTMSLSEAACVVTIMVAMLLLHWPAAAREARRQRLPAQARQLQRLEQIRRLAEQVGVGPDSVREAIGPVVIAGSGGFDGLEWLEPPERPRTMSREQLKRLFGEAGR